MEQGVAVLVTAGVLVGLAVAGTVGEDVTADVAVDVGVDVETGVWVVPDPQPPATVTATAVVGT